MKASSSKRAASRVTPNQRNKKQKSHGIVGPKAKEP
jgi:hypothetical protein